MSSASHRPDNAANRSVRSGSPDWPATWPREKSQHDVGQIIGIVERLKHEIGCSLTDRRIIPAHDRDRRVVKLADRYVVASYERNLFTKTDPAAVENAQRTQHELVAACDDRRRRGGLRKKLRGSPLAVLDRQRAFEHLVGVLEASRRPACLERRSALIDRPQRLSADQRHASVTEVKQMVHCVPHSRLMVRVDMQRASHIDVAVKHHDGDIEASERFEHSLVLFVADRQNHPVDSALGEKTDVGRVKIRMPLGVRQQQ